MNATVLELCPICNGRGQTAPGTACPVCDGKGMAYPARVAMYRQAIEQGALAAAERRAARVSVADVENTWRQARDAYQGAAAERVRAEAAAARAERAAMVTRGLAAAAGAAHDRMAAMFAGATAPVLPPVPPGSSPAVTGSKVRDPLLIIDSIQVRELDVWGAANIPAGNGLTGFLMPAGDLTGRQDTANINAAIAALPVLTLQTSPSLITTAVGTILLGPGQWYINATISVPPWVILQGSGPGTVINSLVNGDAFFMQNTYPTGGAAFLVVLNGMSGGLRDLTVDGSLAGANGVGLHTDSLPNGLQVRGVVLRNFAGASGIGLHMSNSVSFTEKYDVWVNTYNCTTACLMEKLSGGSESFRYGRLVLDVAALGGQSGLVMQAAHVLFGQLVMRANFASQTPAGPANWAMLYLTPTSVGGSFAEILSSEVNLYGEIDLGLANVPQSILFGSTANNSLTQCYGWMGFQNGFTNSNATAACLSFWGGIGNDTVLQGVVQQPTQVTQPDFTTAPQTFSTPGFPGSSGTVVTNNSPNMDVLVYVAGGTLSAATQINGVAVGDVNARLFYLPFSQTIKLTWSVAPTGWVWLGV